MRKYYWLLLLGYSLCFLAACKKEEEGPSPAITGFTPASGAAGSLITISGSSFSNIPTENIVKFSGVPTVVTAATATELTVIVPSGASSGKITVTVHGRSSTSANTFTVTGPPAISGITPAKVKAGGVITIKGANFSPNLAENSVKINGLPAIVTAATAGALTVAVPASAATGKVSVSVAGTEVTSLETLQVLPAATISSLNPASGDEGMIFTITGTNFSTELAENAVKINGLTATVLEATNSTLAVIVPSGATSGKVSVTITGQVATSPADFLVATRPGQWTKRGDFLGTARAYSSAFTINGKGYLIAGSNSWILPSKKDIWEYNPDTGSWTQKADFTGNRNLAVAFAIGSKGYVGTGLGAINGGTSYERRNDFWEYNPEANSWTKKANCPFTMLDGVGFSIGNTGYVGTGNTNAGYTKEFYSYNPFTDQWTKQASFGGTARNGAVGFAIGDKGYIGLGSEESGNYKNDLWEYSPLSGQWIQKADFPALGRYLAIGFGANGKGYVGGGGSKGAINNDFYEYDPAINVWAPKRSFPGGARLSGIGFVINNRIFMGTGYGYENTYFKDFWEFTP